jgi:hypothetical protein
MARPHVIEQRRHPERPDDLLELAPLDRGVDHGHLAPRARGLQRVIEDGAEQRAVGRRRLEPLSRDLLVEVLRRDEVRLHDDPVARGNDVAERVPFGGPAAAAIEAERTK